MVANRKMQKLARLALAISIVMVALFLLPFGGGYNAARRANAQIRQPTPNLTDIFKTPTPVHDDEDDDDGRGGSGGGGGDGDGDSDDDDGGILDKDGNDNDKDGDKDGKGKKDPDGEGPRGSGKGKGKGKGKGERGTELPDGTYVAIPGAFNTNKLVSVAAQLRGLGMSQADVVRRVYPPFIIAGRASWVDTWHAPRYGPAPGQIRQHEGQDVFCAYGDPVLAPENGTVSFSGGGLGGITARVHTAEGAYWYLTHLSDLNTEEFSTGDSVQVGDVIGYCGNSGNAATTPPHVHFGWYQANGAAKNPMKSLVGWLKIAERRVLGVVSKETKQKERNQPIYEAARRFGDDFVPQVAEFRVDSESLWASGSDPSIGATALAEAALRAALSGRGLDYEDATEPVGISPEDGEAVTFFLQPDSALGRLLQSRHISAAETGD